MDKEQDSSQQRVFPAGCTITNIRPGTGERECLVYASLVGPDGELLISATLEYINQQFIGARIEEPKTLAAIIREAAKER